MSNKLSEKTRTLLVKLAKGCEGILKNNFVGFYIHGSLSTGCFNPEQSDMDFLVVTKNHLSKEEKIKITDFLIKNRGEFPAKGIDMSVVLQGELKKFKYPTPLELYLSNSQFDRYKTNKNYLCENKKDKNLAAHLVMIKKRGICLLGKPIKDVFYEIPKKYYLKSIINDSKWSIKNISKGPDAGTCPVPTYGVLNFCRVSAFIDDNKITSKVEGGQWGLKNLPKKYKTIIQQALNRYVQNSKASEVDAVTLKDFAKYSEAKFKKIQ